MKAILIGLSLLVFWCNAQDVDTTLDEKKVSTQDQVGVETVKFDLRYFTNEKSGTDASSPLLVHLTYGDDAKKIAQEQQPFIFSIAKELKAKVIVVEHRYFGSSKVNPTDEYAAIDKVSNMDPKNVLNDILNVINEVRKNNQQVIISGSDYAGELATLFRLKNKDLIFGSIISNAPLQLHSGGGIDMGLFDKQIKTVFEKEGCTSTIINDAMKEFLAVNDGAEAAKKTSIVNGLNLAGGAAGYEFFKLKKYIYDAFVGLAQQNYDVKHKLSDKQDFKQRPLREYCKAIKAPTETTLDAKVKPILDLLDTYYGKSDSTNKHIYKYTDLRLPYVSCLFDDEYHCSQGDPNDYFNKVCTGNQNDVWLDDLKVTCAKTVTNLDTENLDGKYMSNNGLFNYKDLDNVVYIDGEWDPNQVGRATTADENKNQYRFLIQQGAQAVHLINPTTCDPDNVKQARFRTIKIFDCLLRKDTSENCKHDLFTGALPDFQSKSGDGNGCNAEAFPWQQTLGKPTGPQDTNPPGSTTAASKGNGSPTQMILQLPVIALSAFVLLM